MTKRDLRRTALAGRSGPGADLTAVLSDVLAGARRVAAFVPTPSEPGVAPQLGWLLPVLVADGDLDWAVHDGTLVPGPHGLQQPPGPRLGVDALSTCDLVLVPALLVDRHGNRLGRGGGSYDRALARATGLTLALVHDDEVVDHLPTELHDVPVRAIATPSTGVRAALERI